MKRPERWSEVRLVEVPLLEDEEGYGVEELVAGPVNDAILDPLGIEAIDLRKLKAVTDTGKARSLIAPPFNHQRVIYAKCVVLEDKCTL